jgi:hypothetical protein
MEQYPRRQLYLHIRHRENQKCYLIKYLCNKKMLAALLVGEHFLLTDFVPYRIIFMNVCVRVCVFCITVAMVMQLRDFQHYRITFITTSVCCLRFHPHS